MSDADNTVGSCTWSAAWAKVASGTLLLFRLTRPLSKPKERSNQCAFTVNVALQDNEHGCERRNSTDRYLSLAAVSRLTGLNWKAQEIRIAFGLTGTESGGIHLLRDSASNDLGVAPEELAESIQHDLDHAPLYRDACGNEWNGLSDMPDWLRAAKNAGVGPGFFPIETESPPAAAEKLEAATPKADSRQLVLLPDTNRRGTMTELPLVASLLRGE